MTAPNMIEAVGATVRFGEFTANDGIDLQVRPGEVVGLLGANGAGKTTFMRLVLGLLRPSAGRVELFGAPPSRTVRRRVAYVPQGLGLYEDLTVEQNLRFAAAAFGARHRREDTDTGAEARIDAELAAEARTPVRQLPLGLRRRLAFAVALGHEASLLVLDEPTSGVDPLARSRLWDVIRAEAAGGSGVLVSTHYLEEVEHCDRIVVLAGGKVLVTGTLASVVGGRTAVQVDADRWDTAFQVLDAAGLRPSLHGRLLHVMGVPEQRVSGVLQAAGVGARLAIVPATFEEAFVELLEHGRDTGGDVRL